MRPLRIPQFKTPPRLTPVLRVSLNKTAHRSKNLNVNPESCMLCAV